MKYIQALVLISAGGLWAQSRAIDPSIAAELRSIRQSESSIAGQQNHILELMTEQERMRQDISDLKGDVHRVLTDPAYRTRGSEAIENTINQEIALMKQESATANAVLLSKFVEKIFWTVGVGLLIWFGERLLNARSRRIREQRRSEQATESQNLIRQVQQYASTGQAQLKELVAAKEPVATNLMQIHHELGQLVASDEPKTAALVEIQRDLAGLVAKRQEASLQTAQSTARARGAGGSLPNS